MTEPKMKACLLYKLKKLRQIKPNENLVLKMLNKWPNLNENDISAINNYYQDEFEYFTRARTRNPDLTW